MTVPPTASPTSRTVIALLAASFAGGAVIGFKVARDRIPSAILIADEEKTIQGWE